MWLWVCLCHPHSCIHCGEEVSHLGTHGLSCKFSQGRHFRHGALNEIVHRALTAAHIPSWLEPSSMSRSDGKRLDGASIVPWKSGKLLALIHLPHHIGTSQQVKLGKLLLLWKLVLCKTSKYCHLDCHFAQIAFETMGDPGPKTRTFFFLQELGRRLRYCQLDDHSYIFLIQHLSVEVQHGNAASVLGTAGAWQWLYIIYCLSFFFIYCLPSFTFQKMK